MNYSLKSEFSNRIRRSITRIHQINLPVKSWLKWPLSTWVNNVDSVPARWFKNLNFKVFKFEIETLKFEHFKVSLKHPGDERKKMKPVTGHNGTI